jgi:hypothetical protein
VTDRKRIAVASPDDPGAVSCGDVDGLPLGVDTTEEGGHRDVETGREPAEVFTVVT